jgi:hypothetical protein
MFASSPVALITGLLPVAALAIVISFTADAVAVIPTASLPLASSSPTLIIRGSNSLSPVNDPLLRCFSAFAVVSCHSILSTKVDGSLALLLTDAIA